MTYSQPESSTLVIETGLATVYTASCAGKWDPIPQATFIVSSEIDDQLAQATPSNAQMLRSAEASPPPQAWFDDDWNPFVAD